MIDCHLGIWNRQSVSLGSSGLVCWVIDGVGMACTRRCGNLRIWSTGCLVNWGGSCALGDVDTYENSEIFFPLCTIWRESAMCSDKSRCALSTVLFSTLILCIEHSTSFSVIRIVNNRPKLTRRATEQCVSVKSRST
jgi:hypothetical protein